MINFFKNWYQRWKDYFRMKKIDNISETLEEKLLEQMKRKVALKQEIVNYITNDWKVDPKKSKYIKASLRRKVVEAIYAKYREQMRECKINVNNNLQFV